MPSRILRVYTDSLAFKGISAEAERLFNRLLQHADDFGRFYADALMIRSACFPQETDKIMRRIVPALDELAERGLIVRYPVNGREFLSIPKFGQRLRIARSKFPPMDGQGPDWIPGADVPTPPNDGGLRSNDGGLRSSARKVRPDSSLDSGLDSTLDSHADSDARAAPRAGLAGMVDSILACRPEYAHMRPVDVENVLRPAAGDLGRLHKAVADWTADQANATAPLGNPLASLRKMVGLLCGEPSGQQPVSASVRRHIGARGGAVSP